MTDPKSIADAYIALWNEEDEAARHAGLCNGWSEDARYADPMVSGQGREGIAAMIAGARSHFPGHSFTLAGDADGHGAFVRFSWTLAQGDGPVLAAGTDVVRLDSGGHIAEVIGFLDGAAA